MKVGASGKVSPLMFDNHGRRSPADIQIPNEMTSSKYKQIFKPEEAKKEESPVATTREEQPRSAQQQEAKSRGGLSCLKPATLDDDLEPLTKSPERKPMMSPSGRSISDIFGKVAQDKLKSKTNERTPPGTSPFTARRSETEVFTSKRRSFFTGDPPAQIDEKSPDESEGGADDVIKRTKTGLGLGGDILAEMRVKQEKRASVIPKTSDINSADNRLESKEEENPFGGIKLRSTGRASNLTSPTTDFSPENSKSFQPDSKNSESTPENAPEKIKHSSSSIIGLRAANFDTSKSKDNLCEAEEGRPRPPPKPRPWSIVGVDRKSGEYTQVDGGTVTPPSPTENSPEPEEKGEKSERRGSFANRGSVRDMIANLNKPEKEGLGSVGGLLGAQSVRDRIASMNKGDQDTKKKGNSLPRNNEGVSSSAKSPGIKPKNSPHNFRKESTTDDPRILKLDDDFMYEDTVNV